MGRRARAKRRSRKQRVHPAFRLSQAPHDHDLYLCRGTCPVPRPTSPSRPVAVMGSPALSSAWDDFARIGRDRLMVRSLYAHEHECPWRRRRRSWRAALFAVAAWAHVDLEYVWGARRRSP